MDGVPFDKCSPRCQRHLPLPYEVNDEERPQEYSGFVLFLRLEIHEGQEHHNPDCDNDCKTCNDEVDDVVQDLSTLRSVFFHEETPLSSEEEGYKHAKDCCKGH